MKYLIFNSTSGSIRVQCSAPFVDVQNEVKQDEDIIEGVADDSCEYINVDTYEIIPRPSFPSLNEFPEVLANGTDPALISNIPSGTSAYFQGEFIGIVNDGSLEMTFDHPGTYTVRLELFPYIPQEYVINAV